MVDDNRVKRPNMGRKQPNRSTRRILEDAAAAAAAAGTAEPQPDDPPPTTAPTDQVINKAVKLAYRVVDDQMRQGRRAAERVRAGSYNAVDFEADIKSLLDRMIGLTKEAGAVSMELFDTLVRGNAEQKAAGPTAAEVAIEVKSTLRIQVSIDFRPTQLGFVPSTPPLYASDRSVTPLDKLHFVVKEGTRPVFVVEVPDNQPPGTYTGAIVDEKSHEPGGSVCVRILA